MCHLPNPTTSVKRSLIPVRTVIRNTNDYPNWIINQVFEQVKGKQRDPVPSSYVSNKNEVAQTSNQTIVEKHGDKKHLLMIPYQGGKGDQVIKLVRKTIKRLLPKENYYCKFLLLVTNLVSCLNLSLTTDNHQHVGGNNKKRELAEALLIREIKPTLNFQDQSVSLQLFS